MLAWAPIGYVISEKKFACWHPSGQKPDHCHLWEPWMQNGWSPHGVVVVGSPELRLRDGFPAYDAPPRSGGSREEGLVGTSAFTNKQWKLCTRGPTER